MSFKKQIRTYFSYSSSERKSLIVLLSILIAVFLFPMFIHKDDGNIWNKNVEKQKELDSLLALIANRNEIRERSVLVQNLFPFDPNTVDRSGLLSLGFSNYQAKNLLRYRKKGGLIRKPDDLLKLYGMTDSLYNNLKPFVCIPSQSVSTTLRLTTQLKIFDPNRADSLELMNLGFSRFQSQNILKFRKNSGRFKKKEDLLKIYGIDSSDYMRFEKYIQVYPAEKKQKKYHLFSFDPNTISDCGWDSLGLSLKELGRIKNYLAKGGRFRKVEDLKDIYGFDSLKYLELLPYIKIEVMPKMQTVKVDLNEADSIQLLELPGIGPYFSKRIISYREKLGGFYSTNQLLEVFGLKRGRVDSLKARLFINADKLARININTASFEQLNAHPYISYREATDIVRFRKRKGAILTLESLQKKKILRDSLFERVKPYLKLE